MLSPCAVFSLHLISSGMPAGTGVSKDDAELASLAKLEIQELKEARDQLEAQVCYTLPSITPHLKYGWIL